MRLLGREQTCYLPCFCSPDLIKTECNVYAVSQCYGLNIFSLQNSCRNLITIGTVLGGTFDR